MPVTSEPATFYDSPVILLVEDSPDDAYFFHGHLRKLALPHSLTHVSDGQAAVDVLNLAHSSRTRLPDVVFLDLKMPVMNGFEVLEWVQQQPWGDSLNVTVLSGSDQNGDVEQAQTLGASGYLVKPVAGKDLELILSKVNRTQASR